MGAMILVSEGSLGTHNEEGVDAFDGDVVLFYLFRESTAELGKESLGCGVCGEPRGGGRASERSDVQNEPGLVVPRSSASTIMKKGGDLRTVLPWTEVTST